jgi:hypothetical protein
MAKDARAAMKAKARVMGGTADAQPMAGSSKVVGKPRLFRKLGGAAEAKVHGAKSDARADRKPRIKKADAGSVSGQLGFDENMTPAEMKKLVIRNAMRDAMGMVGRGQMRRGPIASAVPIAERATEALQSSPAGAASRILPSVRGPSGPNLSGASAPAALAGASVLGLSSDTPPTPLQNVSPQSMEAVDRGVGTRTDRMDNSSPDMVIRATRPAPVPAPAMPGPETSTDDRLNAISAGQSRIGPMLRDEAPTGGAELLAAQRMMDRRRAIEANPTTGGVDGTFKRGGLVKSALKGHKSKPGKSRR